MRRAITRLARIFWRDDRAVATIEAAVTLPFVLILGAGTIEFGWVMAQMQGVQESLRGAVRYVARTQLVSGASCTATVASAANTAATAMLTSTFQKSKITSYATNIAVNALDTAGTYRGGLCGYRIVGTADFTPVSTGLLAIVNITLPRIYLRYEARHAGG